jgi:iron(III) transport system permease protein
MSGYPARFELAAALSILLLSITAIGMYLQRRQIRGREFVTVTGRGFRPRLIDLGKWRHPVFFLCLFYLAIAFALPLIMLVLSSFTPYFDLRNLQLTTSNWQFILFQHPMTARGIKNSFLLALLTATATTFLALIVSFLVVRTKVVGRSILDYLSMMPVGIPITGFAVALLYAWIQAPIPIYGTIWILFVAYMTMEIPYGMRASSSALRQIDEELEGASRMCGGSWLHTMRKIVLPLMKPGLMAGWVMIFVSSFRESTASILLQSYGNEVFSIVLYERWVEGGFTECSALAALQVIFIFAVILISRKVVGFEIGKIV